MSPPPELVATSRKTVYCVLHVTDATTLSSFCFQLKLIFVYMHIFFKINYNTISLSPS